MHALFTPVDTFDTSTFLHSVIQPNSAFALQWVMPVTGFESNGQSVTPLGFDKEYGLYLTIDASGVLGTNGAPNLYTSLNVTLWADPKNDAGTATSTVQDGAKFSGNTANDIALATGTLVSASMSIDPATMTRSATYVEDMTPTLDGTLLLHGSIHQGSHLTERFTTPSDTFKAIPQTDGSGTTVDLVNGGMATVTLSSADGDPQTVSIPSDALQLPHGLRFIHYRSFSELRHESRDGGY
jgi:hypothetical protein